MSTDNPETIPLQQPMPEPGQHQLQQRCPWPPRQCQRPQGSSSLMPQAQPASNPLHCATAARGSAQRGQAAALERLREPSQQATALRVTSFSDPLSTAPSCFCLSAAC